MQCRLKLWPSVSFTQACAQAVETQCDMVRACMTVMNVSALASPLAMLSYVPPLDSRQCG